MIELKKASLEDAETIWRMQVKSFSDLLEKYNDYDTNPGNESLEKTIWRLNQSSTYFYLILSDGINVGAVRVVDNRSSSSYKRIPPIFILPEYRNQGFAQAAIRAVEAIHGQDMWELETILEEKLNCRLYEKMGFIQTDLTQKINGNMTLIVYKKHGK